MKEFVIIERPNLALFLVRVNALLSSIKIDDENARDIMDLHRLSDNIMNEIKAQEEHKESKQKFKQIPLL